MNVFLLIWSTTDYVLGVVVDVLDAELAQLLSELLGVGDGESDVHSLAGQLLSNLDDTIAHVIGSLDVLDVVHVVVDNDNRALEILAVSACAVSHQAMQVGLDEFANLGRVSRA